MPASVQMTSRSGGESDSMNQRAVSAPAVPAISSSPIVFRFDFDIFSMGPMTIGSLVDSKRARRVSPSCSIFTSGGDTQSPFCRR